MLYQFWLPFIVLSASVLICERKWCMLRDQTKASPQPYSWSRVQLAWWTIIILSSFIAVIWHNGAAPELHRSIVMLLGISAATITAAKMIDLPDQLTPLLPASKSDGFFFDILSDETGVSISRLQTVVFNLVFGIWLISQVLKNLPGTITNDIIPAIGDANLALLGLSSLTYAAIKSTDRKTAAADTKQQDVQFAEDGSVG